MGDAEEESETDNTEEESQPNKFALYVRGSTLAFITPHLASFYGGAAKGVLDAAGSPPLDLEFLVSGLGEAFPFVATSTAYRGVVRGIEVFSRAEGEEPRRERIKSAGPVVGIFSFEFSIAWVLAYVGLKSYNDFSSYLNQLSS